MVNALVMIFGKRRHTWGVYGLRFVFYTALLHIVSRTRIRRER